MAKQASATKPVMRTSAGLRDLIFDEIDAIRNGSSDHKRANAVAKLAGGIVDTVRMELDVHRYMSGAEKAAGDAQKSGLLASPLSLGA